MKSICKKSLSVIVILFAQVALANNVNIQTIGKKRLVLSNDVEVSVVEFEKVRHKYYRSWKNKLIIRKKGRNIFEKYPIMEEIIDNSSFYFVPIEDGKYLVDLNNDGNLEFAVAYDHGGNAPSTSVTLFSWTDRLEVYRKAWYQMEGGSAVIWDKSRVPRKCLYVSDGVCEYL